MCIRDRCDNVVREGMVIRTNSPRALEARRVNMELILSQHDNKMCIRDRPRPTEPTLTVFIVYSLLLYVTLSLLRGGFAALHLMILL